MGYISKKVAAYGQFVLVFLYVTCLDFVLFICNLSDSWCMSFCLNALLYVFLYVCLYFFSLCHMSAFLFCFYVTCLYVFLWVCQYFLLFVVHSVYMSSYERISENIFYIFRRRRRNGIRASLSATMLR